ncbi:hypothetical protein LPB138_13805 [Urechidicola croceus]|uniref:Uncharacterized protein n=2 Tax=Urechidicola croceus TaxID=1850246 RepID=A0A1D8PAS8_9FLAO|nr:hypothetical protein LPB138_13805 [Urechidicola croceus]
MNSMAQKKAKVHSINGVEVYILAEPVREYETVNTAKNGVKILSGFTGGLINESISTKVSKFIKRLLEDAHESGVEFDAIMYTSGKTMTAIKFTDVSTPETKGIATIHRVDGVPFYVMSEPLNTDYRVADKLGKGIKWKSLVTGGLLNNSIEEDLLKFAKQVDGKYKRGKIDAVVYSNGKKAIAIKFE